MNESGRVARIEAALQAAAEPGHMGERANIQWNARSIIVDVVHVPLDAVVLNPRSHRIKAELEAHPERDRIAADPFSSESQDAIAGLLRNTEGFEALKSSLEADGQIDFGVVTRRGVLINANTRAVGLRDLHESEIKVAVLPLDADEPSLEELEAYLQMKTDLRQPYSFPNELLFIQDMITRGRSDEEIALELGWATPSSPADIRKGKERVAQNVRILALLRDVISRSGERVPLTTFDGARQALMELDTEVEKTKPSDASKAERVRNSRILAILANVGYREIRLVDDTFLQTYLPQAFAEEPELAMVTLAQEGAAGDAVGEGSGDTVLDLFGDDQVLPTPGLIDVTAVVDALIQAHGAADILLPGAAAAVPRAQLLGAIERAFEAAADDYKADKTAGGQVAAPLTLVRDAAKKVNKAAQIVERVRTDSQFAEHDVLAATVVLERSIAALRLRLATEQPAPDA